MVLLACAMSRNLSIIFCIFEQLYGVLPEDECKCSINANDNNAWKSEKPRMISYFSIGEIYEFTKLPEK